MVGNLAKSSKDQMEQDESKLLSELMKNSKENIDTIAKRCGFSRQKAWRMINKLEKSKKIWGYSAIVDIESQGLQKFILCQKRKKTSFTQKDVEELAKTQMGGMKNDLGITAQSTYYIHGIEYDWVTIFTAKDIMQAKKFADAINQRFPDIVGIQLSQVLFTLREHCILNPNPMEMKACLI
jgi:DNA-binding Lrp family transcriptional regulator